ncbi:MAG: hypothetical protein Q8N75_03325, partial [Pseudomonadota bacterium]|nr:hypothetical protein [Pseudomonadota bacterium]
MLRAIHVSGKHGHNPAGIRKSELEHSGRTDGRAAALTNFRLPDPSRIGNERGIRKSEHGLTGFGYRND